MTSDEEVQKNLKEVAKLQKAFGGYRPELILAVLVNRLNKSTGRLNILTIVITIIPIVINLWYWLIFRQRGKTKEI